MKRVIDTEHKNNDYYSVVEPLINFGVWKVKCLVIGDDPMICDLVRHFCSQNASIDLLPDRRHRSGTACNSLAGQNLTYYYWTITCLIWPGTQFLRKRNPPLLWFTAEKDFCCHGIRILIEIYDFLVKPLNFDRFGKAIGRVSQGGNESIQWFPPTRGTCWDGNKFKSDL